MTASSRSLRSSFQAAAGGEDGLELRHGVERRVVDDRLEDGHARRGRPLDDRVEDRLLRPEVVVDRAARHAQLVLDVLDAHRLVAAGADERSAASRISSRRTAWAARFSVRAIVPGLSDRLSVGL